MILELVAKMDQQIPEVECPKEFKQSKWHVSKETHWSLFLRNRNSEIEQLVNNRGRGSILKHLKTQIHIRLELVRDVHFLYNQRLWEAKKPMKDAYTYIIGIKIHVRGASHHKGHHYLYDRRDSPVSTVSRAKLMKTLSLRQMNIVTISNRKRMIECQGVQWIELLIDLDSITLVLYQQLAAHPRLSITLDH
ncbi:hypothetical protein OUZ56_011761 [Daphnia magna]|uniref:Uncharacterized protein n=1 Tax=Daphnia magna TaxID=35525 RepID=A0ABQ9Z121_9CRUS|nr:hypothetical protein OUZ56_011761 [Daphnia magna]